MINLYDVHNYIDIDRKLIKLCSDEIYKKIPLLTFNDLSNDCANFAEWHNELFSDLESDL